jgi:Circularly permutated YpsA SLOG family
MRGVTVVSGGQTGVDRAALDAAIGLGLPYRGWTPAGGWAEDCPEPPGLLALYPDLRDSGVANPAHRTGLNVADSDATLILWPRPGVRLSRGTALTRALARQAGKPLLVVDPGAVDAPAQALGLLAGLGSDFALNVAGPRESQAAGIYAAAHAFLKDLLGQTAFG